MIATIVVILSLVAGPTATSAGLRGQQKPQEPALDRRIPAADRQKYRSILDAKDWLC